MKREEKGHRKRKKKTKEKEIKKMKLRKESDWKGLREERGKFIFMLDK